MDTIYIHNYTVTAKHGYYKEEHAKSQRFILNIEVSCDLSTAGSTDNIKETLNYEYIRNHAHGVLMKSPHNLLESLAGEIAEILLAHPKVLSIRVDISKPDIWNDCVPGISIVRSKEVI